MRVINLIKELWRALFFICSIQFWRMALLWTFFVAYSHIQLLKDSLFSQKIVPYPRSSPSTFPNRPVCVITGVRSFTQSLWLFWLWWEQYQFVVYLFINLFCRLHLALDYQLHANFPRMVMLLSLVIPCSFCWFLVFPLFCLSRFK
jgi:hypothetical protein